MFQSLSSWVVPELCWSHGSCISSSLVVENSIELHSKSSEVLFLMLEDGGSLLGTVLSPLHSVQSSLHKHLLSPVLGSRDDSSSSLNSSG